MTVFWKGLLTHLVPRAIRVQNRILRVDADRHFDKREDPGEEVGLEFECNSVISRVFSAFKMAAQRRPWQTAGHVSPKILEILIVSYLQWALRLANLSHVACCLPASSPSRQFDRPEDPGDEDANAVNSSITKGGVSLGNVSCVSQFCYDKTCAQNCSV